MRKQITTLVVLFLVASIAAAQDPVQHPPSIGTTDLPTCDTDKEGRQVSIINATTFDDCDDQTPLGNITASCVCRKTSGSTFSWMATSANTDADQDTYIRVEESLDEDNIRMATAGVERFTIDEFGRVGINESNPTEVLRVQSVAGGGVADLFVQALGVNSTAIVQTVNDSQRWNMRTNTDDTWSLEDATLIADVITVDPGADADSLTIDANGDVGLGKTSATTNLEVSGSTGVQLDNTAGNRLRISKDGASANSNELSLTDGTEDFWIRLEGGVFQVRDNVGNTEPFKIQPDAPDNSFVIEGTTGDIGIGTAFPGVQWDMQKTGNLQTRFQTSGASSVVRFEMTNPDQSWRIQMEADDEFGIRDNTNTLIPFTIEPGAATDTLVIDTNDRVGINSNAPLRDLHIFDTMKIEPRSAAPSSPLLGDVYVDSDTSEFCFYDGTVWTGLKAGGVCA